MKKIVCLFLTLLTSVYVFSQTPISIEKIVDGLNWGNCSETDVIFAFKDNIVKRDHEEKWDGGLVSSFILKNIKIGDYIADGNIIVNSSRKLVKIGGITLKDNIDRNKSVDEYSQYFEEYLSSIWGKERIKNIEYHSDIIDKNKVYATIQCQWMRSDNNIKSSRGTLLIMERGKIIVISIEPKY